MELSNLKIVPLCLKPRQNLGLGVYNTSLPPHDPAEYSNVKNFWGLHSPFKRHFVILSKLMHVKKESTAHKKHGSRPRRTFFKIRISLRIQSRIWKKITVWLGWKSRATIPSNENYKKRTNNSGKVKTKYVSFYEWMDVGTTPNTTLPTQK